MPLSLISRRSFLGLIPLIHGGFLLRLRAEESASGIALMADTHIAESQEREMHKINMAAHFRHALRAIQEERAGHVFLLGDAAAIRGEEGDYRTLKAILDEELKKPPAIHIGMGNHDSREHFRTVFGSETFSGERALLQGRVITLLETETVNWILLDSLEAVNSTPGKYGEEQLSWLDDALGRLGGKPTVVCGHHNPQQGNPDDPQPEKITGLLDSAEFLEVLTRHSHVKAHIFGHTHALREWKAEDGLQMINLPPVAYVFRPEKPSGWALAKVEEGNLAVTIHCLNAEHPDHLRRILIPL